MSNLNSFGKKHIATYLGHYAEGLLTFKEVCSYVGACFDERGKA